MNFVRVGLGLRLLSLAASLGAVAAHAADPADADARKAQAEREARAAISRAEAAKGSEKQDSARRAAEVAARQKAEAAARANAAHPDETPREITLTLDTPFAADANQLSDDARQALMQLAKLAQSRRQVGPIRIEGHANEPGTDEYRMSVAGHRADLVHDFLAMQGVAAEQIETIASPVRTWTQPAGCDAETSRAAADTQCDNPGSSVVTVIHLLEFNTP
ncbi:OmpA family protein [Niveibacterium sp.]|uniref:OmpA family protein n=1 Tax=Niveibacterium sp. TaxID=2017444 RepID=UPI0035B170C3